MIDEVGKLNKNQNMVVSAAFFDARRMCREESAG